MSPASLAKIFGVGQVKLYKYGQAFLEVIRDYCDQQGLTEKPFPPSQREAPDPRQMELTARHIVVGEAYNAGSTVQELADRFQVQPGTILDHLARYALEGRSLRAGGDFLARSNLPPEQQMAALAAFEQLGAERLRPIFERLNGAANYDELKLLRLHYLSTRT
jgi:ATP-dependent DNA helicase RecQ